LRFCLTLSLVAAGILTSTAASQPPESGPDQSTTPPIIIQGRLLSDWITALGDKDPAERKWALQILGRVTRDQVGAERSRRQDTINGKMFDDKLRSAEGHGQEY
jgi:hypothetical protein